MYYYSNNTSNHKESVKNSSRTSDKKEIGQQRRMSGVGFKQPLDILYTSNHNNNISFGLNSQMMEKIKNNIDKEVNSIQSSRVIMKAKFGSGLGNSQKKNNMNGNNFQIHGNYFSNNQPGMNLYSQYNNGSNIPQGKMMYEGIHNHYNHSRNNSNNNPELSSFDIYNHDKGTSHFFNFHICIF